MAFFKFRLPGQRGASESTGGAAPTESVEVLRQRAKHRLIGAAVLVLLGVIGFPCLFDTQPGLSRSTSDQYPRQEQGRTADAATASAGRPPVGGRGRWQAGASRAQPQCGTGFQPR